GSTPRSIAIGIKIGVNINIAGATSITVPINKSNRLIISKIIIGFSEKLSTNSLSASGIPINDMAKYIEEEAAINNMITPVISTASTMTFGNCLIFIVL